MEITQKYSFRFQIMTSKKYVYICSLVIKIIHKMIPSYDCKITADNISERTHGNVQNLLKKINSSQFSNCYIVKI